MVPPFEKYTGSFLEGVLGKPELSFYICYWWKEKEHEWKYNMKQIAPEKQRALELLKN